MAAQSQLSGLDLCRAGAAMLSALYPDPTTHAAAAKRLYAKGQKLMHSGNPQLVNVGFFIHGLSQAAAGKGF
jgi:hypothetical protein